MDPQAIFDRRIVEEAISQSIPGTDGERLPELDRAWPLAGGGACALWRDRSGGQLWPLIRAQHEREERLLAHATERGEAAWLSSLGAYMLDFPCDPALPQLAALFSGVAGPSSDSSGTPVPERPEPTLLRYKPLRRCVFRLGEGRDARYVKCVRPRKVRGLSDLYLLLRAVGGLDLAKPDSVRHDFGALVWQPTPGEVLTDMLQTDGREEMIAATGRNLAVLHTSAVRLPAEHTRAQEIRTLWSWVNLVVSGRAERGAELARTAADLEDLISALAPGRPVPAHRDFHDGQILVDGSRAVFLDFDTVALAEAELDVANFLAHLELRSVRRPRVPTERLAAIFIGAYRAHGGPALHGGRLDWYFASALLRLVCVYSFRAGAEDLVEALWSRLLHFDLSNRALRTEVS